MKYYPIYQIPNATYVEQFLKSRHWCQLITKNGQGSSAFGIFNPTWIENECWLHLQKTDQQLEQIRNASQVQLLFQDLPSQIPSHWVDEKDGGSATLYYRHVILQGSAKISNEPEVLKNLFNSMMKHYQPEGGFESFDSSIYKYAYQSLFVVRITGEPAFIKWKLGQNRTQEIRERVSKKLRDRRTGSDLEIAQALEDDLAAKYGKINS